MTPREVFTISKREYELNEEIHDKEVRLIGENGEQLGIMATNQALNLAEERELDLVKISSQTTPPVCRLMNYGKFRYEQSKRDRKAKRIQRAVELKEIRMSPGIDTADFDTKVKSAVKFLSGGNRVKINLRFRGREMSHTEIGLKLLQRFVAECSNVANIEKNVNMEGRFMSIILSPKNGKN